MWYESRPLRRKDLLELLEQNIRMLLLEDEHRPKAHSGLTAATNVDTLRLAALENLVAAGAVPGNEGALTLTAEVVDLGGVLLLDLLDDGAEDDGAGWVAHPGVELAVGLVGAELDVAVVVAGGLGLLGEGDHVGRGLEVPVLVRPELAGSANTGLHLVDD